VLAGVAMFFGQNRISAGVIGLAFAMSSTAVVIQVLSDRPMWRDREDELDLADIGGKTDAATHAARIASAGERLNRKYRPTRETPSCRPPR
jgi:hypothetical protein